MPVWRDRRHLERKFRQHRTDFSQHDPLHPLQDVSDYEASAEATIQNGIRFTYTDSRSGEPRIGYFDLSGGGFVAATEDDRFIVTHYPVDPDYPRTLLDSDYA